MLQICVHHMPKIKKKWLWKLLTLLSDEDDMFKLKKKLNSLTKEKADPNTVPCKSNTNDYRRLSR